MSSSQPATAPTTAPPTVPSTIEVVFPGPIAFPSSPGIYRIRLQPEHAAGGPTIKYLAAPNTSRLIGPDAHDLRLASLAFDRIPAGDWVVGHLSPTAAAEGPTTKLELSSTADASALPALNLASAGPIWCDTTIDESAWTEPPASERWTTVLDASGAEVHVPGPTELQCMGYASAAVIPAPAALGRGGSVVRVSDWFPGHWQGVENETRAYRLLQERDPGLAPRFLAHVTENHSRVVGFLLEHVADVREAGAGDLEKCRAILGRLHALGIAKRQLSRHSFLVKGDGEVLVRGPFDGPLEGVGEEMLREEMESLERVLAESQSEVEDQAARVLRQADPERSKLLMEFWNAHGFILPFVYWLEEHTGRLTLTLEEYGVLAKKYEDNRFAWSDELQEWAEKRFGPSAEGSSSN